MNNTNKYSKWLKWSRVVTVLLIILSVIILQVDLYTSEFDDVLKYLKLIFMNITFVCLLVHLLLKKRAKSPSSK